MITRWWIAKGLFFLFSLLTLVPYFVYYATRFTRYSSCSEAYLLMLMLALVSLAFVITTFIIFFVQFRIARKGTDYTLLQNFESSYDKEKRKGSKGKRIVLAVLRYSVYLLTFLLSVALIALMITDDVVVHKTLPHINGNMALKGLISDVTIQRESNGVIHVKANNDHDLFFGQGVAIAQERLWQMDFFRRNVRGTLSEVLGNATLSEDINMRTLGLYEANIASIPYLPNNTLSVVEAFVEGINSYLDTKPPLPAEFHLIGYKPDPFTVADGLAMVKILAYGLASNYFSELDYHQLMFNHNLSFERVCELRPDYPSSAPTILDEDDIKHINFTHTFDPITASRTIRSQSNVKKPFAHSAVPKLTLQALRQQVKFLRDLNIGANYASNDWVVSGNKTASGKPLLCNDPHLGLMLPSIWILMHLESPNISVIGATPVLAPGIVIGRNADISWGVTNAMVDVQDVYILQPNANGTSYLYNNTWLEFAVRTEEIAIKGFPNYTLQIRESLYGPVISDTVDMSGQTASLRWTSLDDNDTSFASIVQLWTAKNFTDFRNALRTFVGPSLNFVYADVNGNIGYQVPGRIPVRVPGHTGMIPVPGNGSYDWIGWIKFDELPYVLNPTKNYIATANNKIAPPSYPYLLLNDHDWPEHYRALRIIQMLNETNSHTVETMRNVQYNTVTGLWQDFYPLLVNISHSLLNANAKEKYAQLLDWDGDVTIDSQIATVFEFWIVQLGTIGGNETGTFSWSYPYFLLNAVVNQSNFMAEAFNLAVNDANNQKWGKVHHVVINNPVMSQTPLACLYDRKAEKGGDTYAINVGGTWGAYSEKVTNFDVGYGPSYRQIVDLADMENSEFIIPGGNSGNVLSSGYADQLSSYLAGKYLPMKMNEYGTANTLKLKA